MPFVKRIDGVIVASYGSPQPDQPDLAELDEGDPEFVAFIHPPPSPAPSIVQQILTDPVALNELKQALARV